MGPVTGHQEGLDNVQALAEGYITLASHWTQNSSFTAPYFTKS